MHLLAFIAKTMFQKESLSTFSSVWDTWGGNWLQPVVTSNISHWKDAAELTTWLHIKS